MTHQIIAANELGRNSRVVLDLDEMPYLVDSVAPGMKPDTLLVTFSSGDMRTYTPREPVIVRD